MSDNSIMRYPSIYDHTISVSHDHSLHTSETNYTPNWGGTYYPTVTDTSGYTCGGCGGFVGSYQVHQCPAQLTFPGMTPQKTEQVVFGGLVNDQLVHRVEELEKALQDLLSRSHNRQDEEIHVRTEDGHQGTDEDGGREDTSARERKGDWYWPTS